MAVAARVLIVYLAGFLIGEVVFLAHVAFHERRSGTAARVLIVYLAGFLISELLFLAHVGFHERRHLPDAQLTDEAPMRLWMAALWFVVVPFVAARWLCATVPVALAARRARLRSTAPSTVRNHIG